MSDHSRPASQAVSNTVLYTYRVNILEKAKTLALFDDGISVQIEGHPTRVVSWDDIVGVRLVYSPTRVDRNRYICELRMKSGSRSIITSTTFEGVGNFKDQSVSYTLFVNELHTHLRHRTDMSFTTGATPFAWYANIGCGSIGLLFLLLTFILFAAAVSPIVIVHLVIAAFYIPWLIKYFRVNLPSRYTPDAIPPKALPAAV